MSAPNAIDWRQLEAITHRDPARRGLASFRAGGVYLDAGQLERAATHLAEHATGVAIVTGFAIAACGPPAAETDGPPGAIFLARVLDALGIPAWLISDSLGAPLLRVGARVGGLAADRVLSRDHADCPAGPAPVETALGLPPATISHLIAIERVGPSHTLESIAAQASATPALLARFEQQCPASSRDVRHNMRGQTIDALTPPLDRWFESAPQFSPRVTTIGLLDGGNEIGAGSFAWETLCEAIQGPAAPRIACRVRADFALLAGVSDWAAYALGSAMAALRGRPDAVPSVADQARLVTAMVEEAGAVDGLSGRREPTVDGLPLDQYLQPLADLRAALDL